VAPARRPGQLGGGGGGRGPHSQAAGTAPRAPRQAMGEPAPAPARSQAQGPQGERGGGPHLVPQPLLARLVGPGRVEEGHARPGARGLARGLRRLAAAALRQRGEGAADLQQLLVGRLALVAAHLLVQLLQPRTDGGRACGGAGPGGGRRAVAAVAAVAAGLQAEAGLPGATDRPSPVCWLRPHRWWWCPPRRGRAPGTARPGRGAASQCAPSPGRC
jgi:hypothetical protein